MLACPGLHSQAWRDLALTRDKGLKLDRIIRFVLGEYGKCLDMLDKRTDIQTIVQFLVFFFTRAPTPKTARVAGGGQEPPIWGPDHEPDVWGECGCADPRSGRAS